MTPTEKQYKLMLDEHLLPWCWACGRGPEPWEKPPDWFGPWYVERAHIVNKPRVLDRRLVVLLCSLCHRASRWERIVTDDRPSGWPRLELPHLLWLKLAYDRDFYDREFLQAHSVRRLPRAQQPPACYIREYSGRRN